MISLMMSLAIATLSLGDAGAANGVDTPAVENLGGDWTYKGWAGDQCANASGVFLIADYYKTTDFYSFAAQSNQSWGGGHHPWPWNSPGIDFAVGPASGLSLADPASSILPAGCSYQPTGSRAHGPAIYCSADAENPTLNGLDLGLHDCTPVRTAPGMTGMLTIKNSRLVNGPNCTGPDSAMIRLQGAASLALRHDYIDEDSQRNAAPLVVAGDGTSSEASFILTDSALINGAEHPIGWTLAGPQDLERNVLITAAVPTSGTGGSGGELCELGCAPFPVTYPSVIYSNNVHVIPSWARLVIVPKPSLISSLSAPRLQSEFRANHNVLVVNNIGGPLETVAANISGSVDGNVLRLKAGVANDLKPGDTLTGLPGGVEATVLTRDSHGDVLLSGAIANGRVKDVRAVRQSTVASPVRVGYSSRYRFAEIVSNFMDSTGAYSCSPDFGSHVGVSIVLENHDLLTNHVEKGLPERLAANSCPVSF